MLNKREIKNNMWEIKLFSLLEFCPNIIFSYIFSAIQNPDLIHSSCIVTNPAFIAFPRVNSLWFPSWVRNCTYQVIQSILVFNLQNRKLRATTLESIYGGYVRGQLGGRFLEGSDPNSLLPEILPVRRPLVGQGTDECITQEGIDLGMWILHTKGQCPDLGVGILEGTFSLQCEISE